MFARSAVMGDSRASSSGTGSKYGSRVFSFLSPNRKWAPEHITRIMRRFSYLSTVLVVMLMAFSFTTARSQIFLWVGQTYSADFTSSVMGITYNLSWSTNGGYLDLSGSGFYRDIRPTQYFSGTATVTCEWDYKLTSSSRMQHVKRSVNITCRDNKVYISPSTLTLSPGETAYVSYRHQYDNDYTSYAGAYFQSMNPDIVEVDSRTGEVTAKGAGETYINVYSKISSQSPSCKVTVKKVTPTSVSLPSTMTLTAGESGTLTPTLYPSGAQTTYSWSSSDTAIAKVSAGKVYARHHGKARITVTTANGLKATCNLTVNKSQLKLSKSLESGLYSRGAKLTLTSNEGATIRYTTDGTSPNKNSMRYTAPIPLTGNIELRAIATHPDYLDSEEISGRYEVTDLKSVSRVPAQGGSTISSLNIISVTYNMELSSNRDESKIRLMYNNGESIPRKTAIIGNTLYIIPEEGYEEQKCQVIIEPYALKNTDGEPCPRETFNVQFTDAYNLSDEYPIDIFASGLIRFHLTNKHVLKNYNKCWPSGKGDYSYSWNTISDPDSVTKCIVSTYSDELVGFIKQDGWLWLVGYDGTFFTSGAKLPVKYKNVKDAAYSGEDEISHWGTLFYIDENDELYGIGNDCQGQLLGKGTSFKTNYSGVKCYYSNSPIKILDNVTEVRAWEGQCAAITKDGSLWVWGDKFLNYHSVYSPVKISSNVKTFNIYDGYLMFTNKDDVAWEFDFFNGQLNKVGENIKYILGCKKRGFLITTDHKLYGWGSNDFGQLGVGHTSAVQSSPSKPVFIKDGIQQVSFSATYSLALTDDNAIYGWGSNVGGIIFGEKGNLTSPTLLESSEKPRLTDVEVPASVSIPKGSPAPIPRLTVPADGVCQAVEWSISNPGVAQIDNRGMLTPLEEGQCTATMTVTKVDGSKIVKNVNVKIVPENKGVGMIEFSPEDEVIYYNLQGIAVFKGRFGEAPELPRGVYIIRQGVKAIKTVIP